MSAGTAACPTASSAKPARPAAAASRSSASGNLVGGTSLGQRHHGAGGASTYQGNAAVGVAPASHRRIPSSVPVSDRHDNTAWTATSSAWTPPASALGNARFGIEVSGAKMTTSAARQRRRNVVGPNAAGIEVDNGGQNNVIQGNYSGVGADGVTPVGNKLHGIVIRSDGNCRRRPARAGQRAGRSNNLSAARGPGTATSSSSTAPAASPSSATRCPPSGQPRTSATPSRATPSSRTAAASRPAAGHRPDQRLRRSPRTTA